MTETGTPDVGFIKKRDGRSERFDGAKIVEAMRRAFEDVADEQAAARGLIAGHGASAPAVSVDELEALLASIEQAMDRDGVDCVEGVQDLVERALMERGHFEVAKSYILYRHERAEKRAVRVELARAVAGLGGGIACEEGLVAAGVPSAADDDAAIAPKDDLVEDLDRTLARIQRDFDDPAYDLAMLSARFRALTGTGQDADAHLGALIRAAVELTSQEAPRWEMIAARLLDLSFMRRLAATRRELGISSFGELVRYLTERGLYGDYILASYSVSELEEAAAFMVSERDELFAYSGLDLLISRYVIRAHDHTPLESPQEMFLGIALHLAMNEEPTQRLAWVKRFYDMLSKLEVTMATPTLSNARKPDHQLSSCFIDTVPDSLVGIYRSIDNFAQVSKYGGGMGMYLGKVRATGGSIRGFEGVAGGVIRWIRVINDTAVAVDQLGMRQGAVAGYLDAWHRDLPEFLNLRTNNGDDRMKAHDVFPAVCYPDLFWRMAEESLDQDWHLMPANPAGQRVRARRFLWR
ncbi:MAG: ribonucleotide reductase N-terminal alpha domain-containing protein [Collinsella intestinalis]